MYEQTIKVRYSELQQDGKMGLPQILDYFQDISTFQSEEVGVGWKRLSQMKKAWFLAAWDVEIHRYPEFGESLRVVTIPYDFKGFYGYRNFALVDEQDQMIVKANSTWFWFDVEKGIPTRVEDEIKGAYPKTEKLEMEYRPRKIAIPTEYKTEEAFSVKKYQLDTNGHVNNVQYVAMALEYMEENREVKQLRVDYQKSAQYGDVIYPRITSKEQKLVVQLCNEEGSPYALVEFLTEEKHD